MFVVSFSKIAITTIMSEGKRDFGGLSASAELAVPYRPSNEGFRSRTVPQCTWTGGFVLWTVAPTLGFQNPSTDAATARLRPQANVATPTEDSES